jgi:5'-3' exonuclease
MGIPVYFKSLIENYDHLLIPDQYFGEYDIDGLYLDLNCAIHPCCQAVMSEYREKYGLGDFSVDDLESDMMVRVAGKIDEIIGLVKPRKLLYIAIDGPAPRAKMEQQRTRRYKTTLDKSRSKIWNTNAITPGTRFMEKLGKYLRHYISQKLTGRGFTVEFSDSSEAGEGEHKILNHIRGEKGDGGGEGGRRRVIYGLDADLIMLSLIADKKGMYLLREKTEFNFEGLSEEVKYLYMNIEKLRELILNEVKSGCDITIGDSDIINDYIFLCFLLGNDFIKNIISLNIRYSGLDHLIRVYKDIQVSYGGGFRLIRHGTDGSKGFADIICHSNLQVLLEKLLASETSRLDNIKMIRMKQNMKFRGNMRFRTSKDPEEYEKYERNIPIIENHEERWVDLNAEGWEDRYYIANIMKISGGRPNKESIDHVRHRKREICDKYIESLYWVANYYFKGEVLWDWYYPYNYAPLLVDVVEELGRGEVTTPETTRSHKPYKALEQLLIVFPPQSHYLIPIGGLDAKINGLYITHMFPEKFQMDYMFKRYWWEAHPELPEFDEKYLNKFG